MFEFASFFIVLLTALIFSRAFRSLHVPWIIALIVGGMVIGPHGLKIVIPDTTLEFLKNLGLIFLMFMAGLKTRLSGIRFVLKETLLISIIGGGISFLTGLTVALVFGYEISVAILLGIIFISSSVAVLVPSLEKRGLLYSKIGKTVISSIVIQDIASLLFLAIALQYLFSVTQLPFPIFAVLFFTILLIAVIVKWGIPRLKKILSHNNEGEKDIFEKDLRIIFIILIGMVLISEALGLHSIVGAFLAGIILSEAITSNVLKEKIHVLAYGLFIPIFFVVLGAQTDLTVFAKAQYALILLSVIVVASLVSKFLGMFLASRIAGFNSSQSAFIGSSGIPQLSTTLAVVAVGQQLEILDANIVTALVFLSIITTFIGPVLSKYTFERLKKKQSKNELAMYFSEEVAREFAKHEQNKRNFEVAEVIDQILIQETEKIEKPLYVAELGGGAHPDRYHQFFKKLLKKPQGKIDWVDVSAFMLKLAKEYISTDDYKERLDIISFIEKDIMDYLDALEDESLDVAIMKYVIDYIDNIDELFSLLSLKLQKGGIFVATIRTYPYLEKHSTSAEYFYRGEDIPEEEAKELKDGDYYTIKFLKESGNPKAGYVEGAETVKYFHSKEKIEKTAKKFNFDFFIGDHKDIIKDDKNKEIEQEVLILRKR